MIPVAVSVAWLCFRRPPAPTAGSFVAPQADWIPAHPSDRWECIVIHHSASDIGGALRFDQWHRDKGWDELGYHFVVGNGTDTPDGLVEVGPRWVAQKHGAHCKTPDEFYNQHGIGVCLVGNFDKYEPSRSQVESLVSLCRYLCATYHISAEQIYTHGGITGKTDCPGALLDVELIRRRVAGN
jgi:N-acetyl-anhydromuramyl-L-alanine amidase AmpD